MNNPFEYAHGWINGRMGGGSAIWVGIGVLVIVLLIIIIVRQTKK